MPQRENPRTAGARARRSAALAAACAALACARPMPPPAPAQPKIALGPWVMFPTSTQVTVAWTTAQPVAGTVAYGPAGGALTSVVREPEARTEHRVQLKDLAPLTRYDYRVEGALPARGAFSSAPDAFASADKPFRVLIYGDNRSNNGDHELVVRAASGEGAQLALHTGDMVVNAKEQQLWAGWFDAERDLLSRVALVPTLGNHEITDKGVAYAAHFLEPGLPPYHAVDFGAVHVLVLDSFDQGAGADAHEAAVSDAQRAWAEADVKALAPERHLWVLVHQGPHSHPMHPRPGHGGSEAVRRMISALVKVHPIEAIWAGHEHFYERGLIEGLHYFVVGGGGAPLEDPDGSFPSVQAARKALSYVVVDVCGCHVSGKTRDIFGNVIDSFTLSDCPQACPAATAAAPARAPGSTAPASASAPAAAASAATAAAPTTAASAVAPPARTAAPAPAAEVRAAATPAPAAAASAAPVAAPDAGPAGASAPAAPAAAAAAEGAADAGSAKDKDRSSRRRRRRGSRGGKDAEAEPVAGPADDPTSTAAADDPTLPAPAAAPSSAPVAAAPAPAPAPAPEPAPAAADKTADWPDTPPAAEAPK